MPTYALSNGVTADLSSSMLEDFAFAGEVTGEASVTTVDLGAGNGYAPLFVGRSGGVIYVAPDPAAAEGWTQEALPDLPTPDQVAGCVDAAGTPTVFAIGPDGSSPDVELSRRSATGWTGWERLAVGATGPNGAVVTGLAVAGAELFAVLRAGDGGLTVWQVGWAANPVTWTAVGAVSSSTMVPATLSPAGAPVPGVVGLQAEPDGVTEQVVFLPTSGGAPTVLASQVYVDLLAAGTGADGSSWVFTVDKGGQSGAPSVAWLDGASPTGFTAIPTSLSLTQVAVAGAGSAPLTLFATDAATGTLHLWQPGLPGADLFELGQKLTNLATGTGPAGEDELIGVDAAALRRLWSQASGTDDPGGWTADDIRLPTTQLAGEYAHSTLFSLSDPTGGPLCLAPVQVFADEIVTLTANGVVGTAAPARGLATSTDAAGRVRVTVPTDRLRTAKLKVVPAAPGALALGPAGEAWVVPNERILQKMRVITADQVAGLVKDPADAPAVLQALQAVSKAAYPDNPSPAPPDEQRSWRLRLEAGKPAIWEEISHDEARAIVAATPGQVRDLGGFWDWLEDVVEAVVEGAQAVFTYVVTPIVDGIKAAVSAVIGGVKYVFNAVVETVQRALEFAESVLAAAYAALKRLVKFFGWLFSDARADIWRTKQALETMLPAGLTQLAGLAGQAVSLSDTFFQDAQKVVSDSFQAMMGSIGSQTLAAPDASSLLAGERGGVIDDALDEFRSAATWLWDKIMSLGAGVGGAFALPADLLAKVTSLLGELTEKVIGVVESAVSDFVTKVESFAATADGLRELGLKVLLQAGEDIVLAVLGIADAMSHAFLSVIEDVLQFASAAITQTVSDPLMQALYDLANPGGSVPLTAAGVTALCVAVPTTILYFAIYEKAPFPADVEAAGPPLPAAELYGIVGGLATLYWTGADVYADLREIPTESETGNMRLLRTLVIGNCWPWMIYIAMWPGGPGTIPSFATPKDKWKWAATLTAAVPLCFNLVVTLLSGCTKTGRAKEYCFGLSTFAGLSLAMNIARASGGASASEWLMAFAGPLPGVTKALHDVDSPYAKAAMLITDVVCDFSLGVTRVLYAVLPHEQLPARVPAAGAADA